MVPSSRASCDDDVSRRLAALADDIEAKLGAAVLVDRSRGFPGGASITPARAGALPVHWVDFGDSLLVQTGSGLGGRFELGRSTDDVEFAEDLVRSVVGGRAVEVFAPGRSRLVVTLADGEEHHETGSSGLTGFLSLPFWRRWGRRVEYLPYA